VPEQGVATPEDEFEGHEYRSWIFGHSRWQSRAGLFFALQDAAPGHEVVVDGIDRGSGEQLTALRYVVDALYLTDLGSGSSLVAEPPGVAPSASAVVLQTSARESGPARAWLLDEQKVRSRSQNLVEGDLEDPCKYLLLFVVARAS
jgi:hypothetical protein